MTIAAEKQDLRTDALARRAELRAAAPDAAVRMAENFLAAIPLRTDAVVSAYVAIGDEIDAAPLLERLRARVKLERYQERRAKAETARAR